MNKSAFLKLIQQASNISDQQQDELEKVAAAFPYCQTAHLLLAKSAYDKGSMLSTQRLRRASAYATDRQLLKRIIYAEPVPEPVFEAPEVLPEAEVTQDLLLPEQDTVEIMQEIEETEEFEFIDLPESLESEEAIEDVYALDHSPAHLEETEDHKPDAPEDELDSELALLFTFNSISSSSTDLFNSRELEEPEFENSDQATLEEALHEIEYQDAQQEPEVRSVITEDAPPALGFEAEEESTEPTEEDETLVAQKADDEVAGFFAEEAAEPANPENAEINYSTDEIDRLYAEDALGYWMGSSRMGEVLQLKDDYTRQRPQSFHPELILEYSKTHELEKAIQPDTNVLSHQLDIIDQFLKLNPRLKTMANLKLKPEPQEDLSLKSSKIKKGMASENLANIFLNQGKTKKAVKIYEQLILKYPEKKSYFAEQIEKLQNIT